MPTFIGRSGSRDAARHICRWTVPEDNISYMSDFKPLTEKEKELCYKVADTVNGQIAIPCTGFSYCTEGCPMKIAIPQYFSLYNENIDCSGSGALFARVCLV